MALPAEEQQTILIAVHAWHREQVGGAYKLAGEFAEHLASLGHRVHVVCGAASLQPGVPKKLVADLVNGVHLWRYGYPSASGGKRPSVLNLRAHVRCTRTLVKAVLASEAAQGGRVNVINAHSPLQGLGAFTVRPKRLFKRQGIRLAYSLHSPFAQEMKAQWPRPGLVKRLALLWMRSIEARVYARACVIQSDSVFTQTLMHTLFPRVAHKIVASPGWVDVDTFNPELKAAQQAHRQQKTVEAAQRVQFFTLRRLEKRMGLQNLIAAAAILKKEGLNFEVNIGGSGSLRDALQKQIHTSGLTECVHLLGRLPSAEVPRRYAGADCFVLPTAALEGFGLIVLEAYACGTPVIGAPVGAIPEVMGEVGRAGLCRSAAPEAIAEKMRAFINGDIIFSPEALRAHAQAYSAPVALEKLTRVILEPPGK